MNRRLAILLFSLPLALFAQEAPVPRDAAQISQEDRIKALEEQVDQLSRDRAAQDNLGLKQKFHWGNNWGLELGTGMLNTTIYWEGGIITPRLADIFSFSAKGTYIGNETQWGAQATVRLTAATPLLFNFTRIYSAGELFIKHMEPNPYVVYSTTNLPATDTLAWHLYGGIEAYASSWFAVFAEVGRGAPIKSWDSGALVGTASSATDEFYYTNLFYGMNLKTGVRLYLPTNN